MKFGNFILWFGAALLVIGILILRPVPIVEEEKALSVTGIVEHIGEGGIKDVLILLRDHPTRYYINRGYENGLDMEELRRDLIGKEVLIKYPRYWTPLDWNNSIRHLSKLQIEDRVIFNELK